MCAHSIQTVVESSREPLTVLQSDPQATMLLLRLPPTASLPERRHLRSDVVLQLVAGAVEIDGFVARSLQAPEVLFIPRGRPYSLGNVSTEERVVLFVITPGVTTLESRPFGSVRCPLCSAEIAVEAVSYTHLTLPTN